MGWKVVAAGDHKCLPGGILGLLCREHFPGLVDWAGGVELAYTFEHYASAPDARDREGKKFDNKAQRVVKELWVSLPRTILLNTSHSYHILEIMTTYIMFICRISTDVTRDTRGPRGTLTKPATSS